VARIVAYTMSVDQERAVWDRVEKQWMAVERAEDSLKGTHAGVPTTAQMPPHPSVA
jgi:hypothetical protein